MLASDDRPKRKYSPICKDDLITIRSAPKNICLESESDVDEAFEVPSKLAKRSQTNQEDEDLQLALELSKASPKANNRKSRSSFVFEGAIDKDDAPFQQDDEDEEMFSDASEVESAESEDDDAFEEDESEDEKPKKGNGKKGKTSPVATPKAAAKKVTPAKTKKAPQPKAHIIKNSSAPVAKNSPAPRPVTKIVSRPKPSFPTPSGVNIPGGSLGSGGPRRRVGLSRFTAPKGPVSPVKIPKTN